MRTLNLGILAHVDAGKTSLTERLLHAAGVIDEVGSVDAGSTQTDTLALERQRGITIKSAVVSYVINDVTVNLIDTPGHPDFIAEVERVLSVLDGAVMVISAVEGVQAQTRVLMRTLQRLRIPTLIFVNKIDRDGADAERTLADIADKLTPAIIAMGTADGLGDRNATVTSYAATDAGFVASLVDLLADHDDTFLAAYVHDEAAASYRRLRAHLAARTAQAAVHPVFVGSAITGAGVAALTAGLTELLPTAHTGGTRIDSRHTNSTHTHTHEAQASDVAMDGPVSGTVFKVERGPAGDKIAYARMFTGTVHTRDRLRFGHHPDGTKGGRASSNVQAYENKVTAIHVFAHGTAAAAASLTAGQIGKLWGLRDIQIGDTLTLATDASCDATGDSDGDGVAHGGGSGGDGMRGREHFFAPPTLETIVVPARPTDKGALHGALTQLAEQDPLINLRQDDLRQEISVSLYGEVQKEVIQATLATDYHLDVTFAETTTICIERPTGTGTALEIISQDPNPFLATIGLRIDPAPLDSGIEFRLEIELGSLPLSFLKAIETTVTETLGQGMHGWQVTDCTVTLTQSGYWARQSHSHGVFDKSMSSTAGDFRNLTPLVLMGALREAGTMVCEPMHRFHLELPADTLGQLLPVLSRLEAIPYTSVLQDSSYVLEGDIPAARVHDLQQQLPGLTRGEGVLGSTFDHYQKVTGNVPVRPRTDHNPLDRKEYLLHVVRRV